MEIQCSTNLYVAHQGKLVEVRIPFLGANDDRDAIDHVPAGRAEGPQIRVLRIVEVVEPRSCSRIDQVEIRYLLIARNKDLVPGSHVYPVLEERTEHRR